MTGAPLDPWDVSVLSVWDKLEGIPVGRTDADFSLQSAGGSIQGRVEGCSREESIIVLVLDEDRGFAGWVRVEEAQEAFDFRMDHLREGFHTAYALSLTRDEMPECRFGVIEGETLHLPLLAFGRTSAEEGLGSRVPVTSCRLYANVPNPFNSVTTIPYDLSRAGEVRLILYALNGQQVVTLVSGYQVAGHYEVAWDGSRYGNGVYLYRLETKGFVQTRKMVLAERVHRGGHAEGRNDLDLNDKGRGGSWSPGVPGRSIVR